MLRLPLQIQVSVMLQVSGQTAAHIHTGPINGVGMVMQSLPVGTFQGATYPITASNLAALTAGGTYVNVHTVAYSAGACGECAYRGARLMGVRGNPTNAHACDVWQHAYVCICVRVCSAGEIRGQVVFNGGLAYLTGSFLSPPVTTTMTGSAVVTADSAHTIITLYTNRAMTAAALAADGTPTVCCCSVFSR